METVFFDYVEIDSNGKVVRFGNITNASILVCKSFDELEDIENIQLRKMIQNENSIIFEIKGTEELSVDKMMINAFKMGVAENAMGVFHNIGNLLAIIKSESTDEDLISTLNILLNILKKLSKKVSQEEFMDKDKELLNMIVEKFESVMIDVSNGFKKVDAHVSKIVNIIRTQQDFASSEVNVPATLNLKKVIEDILVVFNETLKKNKIAYEVDIKAKDYFEFDKISFFQIFSNCLTNFIDVISKRYNTDPSFTNPQIKISSEEINGELCLIISDNGEGFTNEIKEEIFHFGFSMKNRGSGFGLHHSSIVMKRYGGRIEIDSKGENTGATVSLFFKTQ